MSKTPSRSISRRTFVLTGLWWFARWFVVWAVLAALCGAVAGLYLSVLGLSVAWLLKPGPRP